MHSDLFDLRVTLNASELTECTNLQGILCMCTNMDHICRQSCLVCVCACVCVCVCTCSMPEGYVHVYTIV